MDKKDYKAISEIIHNMYWGSHPSDVAIKLANDLADYFEKEDKPLCNHCLNPVKKLPNGVSQCLTCKSYPYESQLIKFNREQFIKDCGIKE